MGTAAFQLSPSSRFATNQFHQELLAARQSSPPRLAFLPTTHREKSSSTMALHAIAGKAAATTTNKDKELAFFPKLSTLSTDTNVKYESLSLYISAWSRKFEEDRKAMRLTTPVKISTTLQEGVDATGIAEKCGVRIMFNPTKVSYKSVSEEKAENDTGTSSKKKKNRPIKEGGVEIRVEKTNDGVVQLRARRCDTEEDTMVKEMSEEVIISELKKAIAAWKKL